MVNVDVNVWQMERWVTNVLLSCAVPARDRFVGENHGNDESVEPFLLVNGIGISGIRKSGVA